MGQLRASVRAYALEGHQPIELLRRVDRVVQAIDESQLTTCIYAVYDSSTRDLTLAVAGHLPPLVIDATGPRFIELEPGIPLGVGGASFGQTRVPLAPGSTVLLYTDGLVEGPDCPIGVGMARLLEAAREAPAGVEDLCDHLLGALGRDGDHDDDTALLAVTLTSADRRDPHEPAELSLPLDPESAASARSFVARTLGQRGLMRHCDVAVLLASELVTNALRHARTEVRLRVATSPGRLRIEVVDGSGQVPLPRHAIPDQDESGRGMVLVAGLSDRWGAEPGFGGKCVWFELDT
jgi:anti-sigma regulatory factor (Ser/Thr protein kinase)